MLRQPAKFPADHILHSHFPGLRALMMKTGQSMQTGFSAAGKNLLLCFAECAETRAAVLAVAWRHNSLRASSWNPEQYPMQVARRAWQTTPVYRHAAQFQSENWRVPVE